MPVKRRREPSPVRRRPEGEGGSRDAADRRHRWPFRDDSGWHLAFMNSPANRGTCHGRLSWRGRSAPSRPVGWGRVPTPKPGSGSDGSRPTGTARATRCRPRDSLPEARGGPRLALPSVSSAVHLPPDGPSMTLRSPSLQSARGAVLVEFTLVVPLLLLLTLGVVDISRAF